MKVKDYIREKIKAFKEYPGGRVGAISGAIESLEGDLRVLKKGITPLEHYDNLCIRAGWDANFFGRALYENCQDDPEAKPVIEKWISYQKKNEKFRMNSAEKDFLEKGETLFEKESGDLYFEGSGPNYITEIFSSDFLKWKKKIKEKFPLQIIKK